MKGIYMFFANGFEETEAIAPADVIKRGGADIRTVSIYADKYVTSSHGITVVTDMTFGEFLAEADFSAAGPEDVMIFPGGLPGSSNLAEKAELMEIMRKHHAEGGTVAAICAAPSVVLGLLPDLKGRKMTCYDGFEGTLVEKGAEYVKEGVVADGNIITSRGAGHAVQFGLAIVAHVKGAEKAEEVKKSIML